MSFRNLEYFDPSGKFKLTLGFFNWAILFYFSKRKFIESYTSSRRALKTWRKKESDLSLEGWERVGRVLRKKESSSLSFFAYSAPCCLFWTGLCRTHRRNISRDSGPWSSLPSTVAVFLWSLLSGGCRGPVAQTCHFLAMPLMLGTLMHLCAKCSEKGNTVHKALTCKCKCYFYWFCAFPLKFLQTLVLVGTAGWWWRRLLPSADKCESCPWELSCYPGNCQGKNKTKPNKEGLRFPFAEGTCESQI